MRIDIFCAFVHFSPFFFTWREVLLGQVAGRAGLLHAAQAAHVVHVDGGDDHRHVQRVPVEPPVLVAGVEVVQHKLWRRQKVKNRVGGARGRGGYVEVVGLDVHWLIVKGGWRQS